VRSRSGRRVVELCNELRLGGVAAQYAALARKAAEKRTSFTGFVEELLTAGRESRPARTRGMFARIAGSSPRSRLLISTTSTSSPARQFSEIAKLGSPGRTGTRPPLAGHLHPSETFIGGLFVNSLDEFEEQRRALAHRPELFRSGVREPALSRRCSLGTTMMSRREPWMVGLLSMTSPTMVHTAGNWSGKRSGQYPAPRCAPFGTGPQATKL